MADKRVIKPLTKGELHGYETLTGDLVKLDVGQAIRGKLVSVALVKGDAGEYPIFTLSDDEGAFKVAGTVQIADALQTAKTGDELYIARGPNTKSNKGRPVQTYDVRIKRAELPALSSVS